MIVIYECMQVCYFTYLFHVINLSKVATLHLLQCLVKTVLKPILIRVLIPDTLLPLFGLTLIDLQIWFDKTSESKKK